MSLLSGLGIPVELRQLIAVSYSRFYNSKQKNEYVDVMEESLKEDNSGRNTYDSLFWVLSIVLFKCESLFVPVFY